MKTLKLAIISSALLLSACGTYQLGHVSPQAGKTRDQQQLDMLTCKDEARLATNSVGQQTGRFIAGMTLVGIPLAYQAEKAQGRETFTTCMRGKGYTVADATD